MSRRVEVRLPHDGKLLGTLPYRRHPAKRFSLAIADNVPAIGPSSPVTVIQTIRVVEFEEQSIHWRGSLVPVWVLVGGERSWLRKVPGFRSL